MSELHVDVVVPRVTPSGRELAPATGSVSVPFPSQAQIAAALAEAETDVGAAAGEASIVVPVAVTAPDGARSTVDVAVPVVVGGKRVQLGERFVYTAQELRVPFEVVDERELVYDGNRIVGSRTLRYDGGGAS